MSPKTDVQFNVKHVQHIGNGLPFFMELYVSDTNDIYLATYRNIGTLWTKIEFPVRPDHKHHNVCFAVNRAHALFYVTHKSATDSIYNFHLKLRRSGVEGFFSDVSVTAHESSW